MKLILLFVVVFSALFAPLASGAEPLSANVAANRLTEFEFVTALKRADPFNEVVLDVIFTEPGGKERRVPAFWAGDRVWKVRYSSPVVGKHAFRTESSDARDSGLHGITGSVNVEPYTGDHPLYKHGRLKVATGGRFFEHADGTPFLWLGDTWWMGLTKRLSFPEEFNTLLADRKTKGFNVIQIVAGLYPDMPAFDPRGENETGVPWQKEYKAIRPEYFDAADKRIMRLVEDGFTPCIVSAWGYHLPFLGPERMKQHQRYVYARWGALPIIWCLAGEFNLPYYLAPDFPKSAPQQAAEWEAIVPYCRSINAFDRLITLHPWLPNPMSARSRLKDPTLLDFDMLQTGHGQMEILGVSVEAVRHSYAAKPTMPVVNAEPSYEMLLDKTPAEIARLIFWASWFNGTGGYTYGANGIWQVNGREKRYGASPHGGDYGKIPWEEAMHLAGSTQVSLGKKLLEQYPWQKFEPKPQWAAWAETEVKDAPVGDWIWFPEGEPATDAPVATRFFRRSFEVPAGAKVAHAKLRMTADDKFTVSLDGKELGTRGNWKDFAEFDLADKLAPGKHVLAVRAENLKADVAQNPAGLVAGLIIGLADGKRIELSTDSKWRVNKEEPKDWQKAEFDDSGWSEAKSVAKFGAGPWGQVGATGNDPYAIPYAIGIDREVRIVYVLRPGAIVVRDLEPDVRYSAFHVDPVTGEKKALGDVERDANGSWRCETPNTTHDWVLILEAKK
jgi:hypothetical protein